MQEAMELYSQAQKMAQEQVMAELRQMELSEMSTYHEYDSQPSTSAPASSPSQPAGSTRREPRNAATMAALTGFWLEQGMPASTAERLARELLARNSRFANLTLLATQLQRLGRVIPGRVQDLVAGDLGVLDAGPAVIAAHYVTLVQLFQGRLDVAELAVRAPRLLYCDDLAGRYEAVMRKLVALHPSHSRDEVQALLAEHPSLICRVHDYYLHVRSLDELPMEVQNMVIYTGQGLQQLHQMHHDGISPRFL